MAKDKKYYWHGKHSVLIGDTTYLKGEEIPHKKMVKEALERFMDSGDISTAEIKVEAGASETVLQAQYRELKEAHTKLLNEVKAGKTGKGKNEPCKECEKLQGDINEKAALIEKHEATIVELEEENKELTDKAGSPDSEAGGGSGGPDGL